MSKMKEAASRASAMQPKPVSSGSRPRVLTRSRSLALPLGDLDLSLPLDCPGGGKGEGGGGGGGGGKVPSTSQEPTKREMKKLLRRQKSFAELFGVVIYKSKVQLQELFSRREKDSSKNKKKDASPVHGTPQADAGATGGAGAEVGVAVESTLAMVEGAVGASPARGSPAASPGRSRPRHMEQLVPGAAMRMRYSNPELSCRRISPGGLRSRTPEELFCVTGDSGDVERPLSSRSLDMLHGDKVRASHDLKITSPSSTDQLLKPDRDFQTKTALVKSNSDSFCRLVLSLPETEGAAPLTKASSDDACFVHRQHSALLLTRNSNVNFNNNKSRSSNSSPQASSQSLSCINSIVDWLLVGSMEAAYNEPLLCSLQVEAIVDITNVLPQHVPMEKKTTCPCTCSKKHFRSKLNLALDDIEWENIEQHFNDVNAFINGWRQRGKRVLVVSYHGKSRAPAVAVQHLMTYYRIPLERALAHVRSRRLQTRINPGFMKALQRLEKRLAAEGSLSPPPPPFPVLAPPSPRTAWDEC